MERLNRKFETARYVRAAPVCRIAGKSKIGIIAFGTSHWAIDRKPRPVAQRIRHRDRLSAAEAYPFTREVHDFVKKHDRVYVVEQNRDAQMLSC